LAMTWRSAPTGRAFARRPLDVPAERAVAGSEERDARHDRAGVGRGDEGSARQRRASRSRRRIMLRSITATPPRSTRRRA
jgi:hypothetical protein